jgi:hypothetical protein
MYKQKLIKKRPQGHINLKQAGAAEKNKTRKRRTPASSQKKVRTYFFF